jgi:hypothetical protein
VALLLVGALLLLFLMKRKKEESEALTEEEGTDPATQDDAEELAERGDYTNPLADSDLGSDNLGGGSDEVL